uniref:Uncharacterized protein n=1 Tax=Tanacetum cinerariifolium TaxID=118510 RepID=A0A6L2M8L3_TANCI|nr:hypothetical protein [Tanacetum cinerariifolium]
MVGGYGGDLREWLRLVMRTVLVVVVLVATTLVGGGGGGRGWWFATMVGRVGGGGGDWTSSNPRTQTTIQDGRVIVHNIQRRQSRGYGEQEAGVILHKDQQDFLADRLEEMDDCDDL